MRRGTEDLAFVGSAADNPHDRQRLPQWPRERRLASYGGPARMMVENAAIDGVKIITPRRLPDARGWFSETYSRAALRLSGIDLDFVQDNQSLSTMIGSVRGLHFQMPPFAQAKLIRVMRGAILDVVVDLRLGSASFGRHVAVELSAENGRQLFAPGGFAHGFCTLTNECEVFYKVSQPYSRDHEGGLAWDDPDLAIAWPVARDAAILSDKDRALPRLRDIAPLPAQSPS